MSRFASIAGLEALSRAREAEGQSNDYRAVRDAAVADALAAGVSPEQIADELGVRIRDVEAMVAEAAQRRAADSPSATPA